VPVMIWSLSLMGPGERSERQTVKAL
jgi:hypothetical protein